MYLDEMTDAELVAERDRLRVERRAMLYRMAEISNEMDERAKSVATAERIAQRATV